MRYLGKKVHGEDGHGGSVGEIVGLEKCKWQGTVAVIQWGDGNKEGHKETYALHQLKPLSKKCGIGVYIED